MVTIGDLLPSLQLWRLCRSDTRRLGQMARKGERWGQLWKWEAQGMLPVDWTRLRRSNSCTPHSFRAAGNKTLLCCWASSESVLFLFSCSAMLLLIEGRLMWFILYNILRMVGLKWKSLYTLCSHLTSGTYPSSSQQMRTSMLSWLCSGISGSQLWMIWSFIFETIFPSSISNGYLGNLVMMLGPQVSSDNLCS